jgi:hypothetical protein
MCIPKNAPDYQVRDTRRAFYAGMASFFAIVDGADPYERVLYKIHEELLAFGVGVLAEEN